MKSSPSNFDASRHEWHEKILRYFAGALSSEEQRALNQALKESETLRQEFALLAVQQVHIGQLHEEEAGKIVSLAKTVRPNARPWYQQWPVSAAAACVILLAGVLLWPKGGAHQPELRFASIQGEVWVQHGDTKHRAKPGAALEPGEVVQTSFGAEAVLTLAGETTRIALAEESVLALPDAATNSYRLEAGILSAVVAPQPRGQTMIFSTPQAEARIIGTEFCLAAQPSVTHLAVNEGKVQLRRLVDGASVQVAAGQLSVLRENLPLVARPLPPAGQGTGLLGEYFSWGNFAKPTFRRLDPKVQFDWGTGRPGPGLNEDHFQVRWTGTVQPKFSERYIFKLVADDGVRFWVNGQLLVDQWVIRSQQTNMRGEIMLEAGRKYDLKLEYFESSGKAFVSLYWQSDSQSREIITSSQLYPPGTNAIPTAIKP